jgi:SAM-dependent methyltransferase
MGLLSSSYYPKHGENRLYHAGDIGHARRMLKSQKSANLRSLLASRYGWMNTYIDTEATVLEVGSGAGFSRDHLRCKKLIQTDVSAHEHLDITDVNAEDLPFEDGSFECIVAANVLHHLPHPVLFFREAYRVLKPKGRILILDCYASVLMRLVLRLTRHEGYDFEVNVFDPTVPISAPNKPWNGNNAVARLLFDDFDRFHKEVEGWSTLYDSPCECFILLNSGGVTAKAPYLPLPPSLCRFTQALDAIAVGSAPNWFALARRTVLERIE